MQEQLLHINGLLLKKKYLFIRVIAKLWFYPNVKDRG